MTRRGTNISLKSYEDIFTTEEKRQETGEQVVMIPVNQIHEFKNHPFKVLDDEDMRKTVDSIREYGVLVPVIIRPDGNGEYEMISGHRRRYASIMAGKKEVPAIIREMDDDTATILMVDSNLQREHILVLCQDLVQVKMRNFSHFNPPEAQPQCVFFHTIVRIHLVTYSYNGYEFVSYCRKLPDIRKSSGMPACNREF